MESVPAAMTANLIAAATVVAGLLLSLRLRFAASPRVRRALPRIAVLVTGAGATAVVPVALIAYAASYSWHPLVLVIEGGLVGVAVVVGNRTTSACLR